MNPLYLMLLGVPVAILITWRLLIGTKRHHRDEHRASVDSAKKSVSDDEKRGLRKSLASGAMGVGDYRCKKLQVCIKPCKAAVNMRSQTFLLGDEPELPLLDCDRPQGCHCEFRELEDRRTRDDRRIPAAEFEGEELLQIGTPVEDSERRAKKTERRRPQRSKSPATYNSD